MRLHVWICGAVFLQLALGGVKLHADEFTVARYRQLLEELTPPADAPWRTIPWKISLLDAQQAAATEGKPIFIWAMDGHPLGCT